MRLARTLNRNWNERLDPPDWRRAQVSFEQRRWAEAPETFLSYLSFAWVVRHSPALCGQYLAGFPPLDCRLLDRYPWLSRFAWRSFAAYHKPDSKTVVGDAPTASRPRVEERPRFHGVRRERRRTVAMRIFARDLGPRNPNLLAAHRPPRDFRWNGKRLKLIPELAERSAECPGDDAVEDRR